MPAKVGVLALQGGVEEHMASLRRLGVTPIPVRRPEDLEQSGSIILPGGESTTLIRLMRRWDLADPVRRMARAGASIWGTCAGAVLLCKKVTEQEHDLRLECLNIADVHAVRNRFGRQRYSFREDLAVKGLDGAFSGIFIRAPLFEPLDEDVEVLSRVEEGAVFLRQANVWLSSFHPELSGDDRIHELFLRESGIDF